MNIKVSGLRIQNISDVMNSKDVHCVTLNFISGSPNCIQMQSSGVGCMPDIAPHLHSNDGENVLCEKDKPQLIGVFDDDMAQTIVARIHSFHLDGIQFQGDVSPVLLDNLRRTLVPDICPKIMIVKYVAGDVLQMEEQCEKYGECVDAFLFDGYSDDAVSHMSRFLGKRGKMVNTPFYIRVDPDGKCVAELIGQMSHHPLFEGIDIDFSLSKDDVDVHSVLREISGML